MTTLSDDNLKTLQGLVIEQGSQLEKFVDDHRGRFTALEERVAKIDGDLTQDSKMLASVIQKQEMRQPGTNVTSNPLAASGPQMWRDVKSGRPVPVLGPAHRLTDHVEKSGDTMSFGRFLRGIVTGGRADDHRELSEQIKGLVGSSDPSGGYLLPVGLSSNVIDLVRARMALSRAGISVVPMDTRDLTVARLSGDPTVEWHSEGGNLTPSAPTFAASILQARTATTLVKLSLELSRDAPNIESALERAVTGALALALDQAGLNGSSANAAVPRGILSADGRHAVASIGAPSNWDFVLSGLYELAADDLDPSEVGAMVMSPAVWQILAKMKTGISSDNTTLVPPPEVARLPRLVTTSCPSGTAVMGRWSDLLLGVRSNVEVRVLDQTFLGDSLEVALLGILRADFVPIREESFVTLEGIAT